MMIHLNREASAAADSRIYIFFVIQILAVIFLERIAIPGLGIDVSALIISASMAVSAFREGFSISPSRCILYCIMAALTLVSQSLVADPISFSSLSLLLLIYLPVIVEAHVRKETYLHCMSFFQNTVLVICVIVVVQDAWQFAFGWESFPDMDRLLPDWLIVPGYNYQQPLAWQSSYVKPNAFFFKEVSFVSQFIALAFIIEASLFQRIHRLAFYFGSLFATFAGTGLFMIALVFPFLIVKQPPKRAMAIVALAGCVLGIAVASGWYDQIAGRLTEYESKTTSSYGRFVFPFVAIYEHLSNHPSLVTGIGAGNVVYADLSYVYLAISKLIIEYGPLVAIGFHLMLLQALFSRAPDNVIAAGLLVLFSLMGGYLLSPTIVYTVILLGTLFRIRNNAPPQPDQGFNALD
jgi:hypothetical protein